MIHFHCRNSVGIAAVNDCLEGITLLLAIEDSSYQGGALPACHMLQSMQVRVWLHLQGEQLELEQHQAFMT